MHDIDKAQDNRGLPKPNANDQKSEYSAQGTTQAQNHGAEATADGLKIKERQILAVQDGYEKAAFGFYGAAGKFGLKVAKDGFDATTTADENLVFNSEQNTFKIIDSGTITFPALSVSNPGVGSFGGNLATNSRAHGLGYQPAIIAFINDGSNGYQSTPFMSINPSGTSCYWFKLYLSVNATDILATIDVTVTGRSWTTAADVFSAKYYLLQETAN